MARKRRSISELLPWDELESDGDGRAVVFTREGRLMALWKAMLPDTSASVRKAEEAEDYLASWARNIDDSRGTFWFDLVRRKEDLTLPDYVSEAMDPASLEIERHRQELFSRSGNSSRNAWYFAAAYKVAATDDGIPDPEWNRVMELFSGFETMMHTTGAVLERMDASEALSYLATCEAGRIRHLRSPSTMTGVSEYISTDAVRVTKPMVVGDRYIQPLTIHMFPNFTDSHCLDRLVDMPFEYRLTFRVTPLDSHSSMLLGKRKRAAAKGNMKDAKTLIYESMTGEHTDSADPQAKTDLADSEAVLESLTRGETLVYLTVTLTLSATSMAVLDDQKKIAIEQVRASGFDCVDEDFGILDAWLGAMPGETRRNLRRPILTASNLADIIPYFNVYTGSTTCAALARTSGMGFAHVIGHTYTNEPYFLNLSGPKDDVGHTFILGGSGGGKSVLLALLGTQWMRYPGSRVILFDKDMSFSNICSRCGGAIYEPGAPDSSLSFMPLARIHTNRTQCVDWIIEAVRANKTGLSPQEVNEVEAVCRNWDTSKPTVKRFMERLEGAARDNRAIPALRRIVDDAVLGPLFGAEEDTFSAAAGTFRRMNMIEMGSIMRRNDGAVLPLLSFLFGRIDELFDMPPQPPTLLVLDEAWMFLAHDTFRRKVGEWLKTLRKKNVFVVIALQNIGDIANPEEFCNNCHTKIFLPNSALLQDTEDNQSASAVRKAYSSLGLDDEQMQLIACARRKRDYIIIQDEGVANVNFEVDAWQLQRLAKRGN